MMMGIKKTLLITVVMALSVGLHGKNLTILQQIDPSNHELLDVEIGGNLMMIPGGLGGTAIFDVADPAAPVQISSVSVPAFEYGRAYNWEIVGTTAYGTGRNSGLVLVNISDPVHPQIISYLASEPYSFEHVRKAGGDILLVSAHSNGVLFYDISNHLQPELQGQIITENAWAADQQNGIAFIANGEDGIVLIDFTDIQNPFPLAAAATSGAAKDVRVQGNLLFVAVGNSGVDLFDIGNPQSPEFLGNYNTPGFASRIGLMGNGRVAVSDWDDMEVLEWNGTSLERIGYKNTGGRVMAVEAVGDIIFSAEWRYLQLYEYGPVSGADIDLSTRVINFPYLDQGESDTVTVQLTNNGNAPLIFDWAYVTHEDFSAETQLDPLFPNHSYNLDIIYTGNSPNASGVYNFVTNDPDEGTSGIQLNGNNNGINVGEPAPDFSLSIVSNGSGTFHLNEQLGKVVVMAFFAPW